MRQWSSLDGRGQPYIDVLLCTATLVHTIPQWGTEEVETRRIRAGGGEKTAWGKRCCCVTHAIACHVNAISVVRSTVPRGEPCR